MSCSAWTGWLSGALPSRSPRSRTSAKRRSWRARRCRPRARRHRLKPAARPSAAMLPPRRTRGAPRPDTAVQINEPATQVLATPAPAATGRSGAAEMRRGRLRASLSFVPAIGLYVSAERRPAPALHQGRGNPSRTRGERCARRGQYAQRRTLQPKSLRRSLCFVQCGRLHLPAARRSAPALREVKLGGAANSLRPLVPLWERVPERRRSRARAGEGLVPLDET